MSDFDKEVLFMFLDLRLHVQWLYRWKDERKMIVLIKTTCLRFG